MTSTWSSTAATSAPPCRAKRSSPACASAAGRCWRSTARTCRSCCTDGRSIQSRAGQTRPREQPMTSALPRILEPEVMDTPEEARDYDAMDHSAVNRAFASDFLALWDGRNPVLDAGTGTAQIPIETCRQNPSVTFVAVDAAQNMLALARENVAKASLDGRIRLEWCDAKFLTNDDGAFGAVVSNSIVHHVPEPMVVLSELVRVLAPGGLLFVRDLLRPADGAAL